ncbi:MAG: hypothetical protein HUK03_05810 [Bacteroidaceae bacterium]|nr:hypothetical protein [Bacteroidaceae bacterium]
MGVLEELIAAGIGYGVASARDSKIVGDIIDNNLYSKPLEDIIKNYARRHLDITYLNNEFAHRLHMIAKQYEEHNYDDIYGDY